MPGDERSRIGTEPHDRFRDFLRLPQSPQRRAGDSPVVKLRIDLETGRDHGGLDHPWVRLNKCTETAIARDDSEIGRFLCSSSSTKSIERKTRFRAEKVGCRCVHCMETC
jgi:hypothetical protein